MQITIDLDPQTKAQLDEIARREGVDAPTLVRNLVTKHLPSVRSAPDEEGRKLIALLQSWRAEDETDDAEELERRDSQTDALLQSLQSNRLSFPTEPAQ